MGKRNTMAAIAVGIAMMTTTTMPVFAATSSVQGKLDKNLKNAQKWAENQTQKLLDRNDPTAAQVTAGLLKTYAKIQVWPKGLLIGPNWNQPTNTTGDWQTGAQRSPTSAWVGLKTVFPGRSASQWPKLLGMTNAPENKPITAATLAKWIMDWEIDAHRVNTAWEPTKSAFNLLRLYNFWYGTNLTKPTAMVNGHDLSEVEKNIIDVSQGYRMLSASKVQLLMPMVSYAGVHTRPTVNGYFTRANWAQKGLAPAVRGFDTTTFTFLSNGDVVFDYNSHFGYVGILNANFVRNGINVGQDGPVIDNVAGTDQWRKNDPIPITMPPTGGPYTGQRYTGITVPSIKNNFFIAVFTASNAYLASKYGGAVALTPTPDYVISSSHGRIDKVGVVYDENFPDLVFNGLK